MKNLELERKLQERKLVYQEEISRDFDLDRVKRIEEDVLKIGFKNLPIEDRNYIKDFQKRELEEHNVRLGIMREEFEKENIELRKVA